MAKHRVSTRRRYRASDVVILVSTIFSLVQKDIWNDGGIKDFKLSVEEDGGQFTEVERT